MQFQYGSYFHVVNSVSITSWRREFVRGQSTQRQHLARTNCQFRGKLVGNSVQAIQAQIPQLEAAYSVDGQIFVELDDFGNTTCFIVDTTQTVGGTRVTNPISFENVAGAQGVTYLYYTFGLTWDVLWSAPGDVLEFEESLEFADNQGLPLQVERVPVNGYPIIQNVSQSSLFYCTQSGTMWQSGSTPQTPAPTYPGQFRGTPNSRSIKLLPTKAIRGTAYEYGIGWKFDFVSTVPFGFSSPNFR